MAARKRGRPAVGITFEADQPIDLYELLNLCQVVEEAVVATGGSIKNVTISYPGDQIAFYTVV